MFLAGDATHDDPADDAAHGVSDAGTDDDAQRRDPERAQRQVRVGRLHPAAYLVAEHCAEDDEQHPQGFRPDIGNPRQVWHASRLGELDSEAFVSEKLGLRRRAPRRG